MSRGESSELHLLNSPLPSASGSSATATLEVSSVIPSLPRLPPTGEDKDSEARFLGESLGWPWGPQSHLEGLVSQTNRKVRSAGRAGRSEHAPVPSACVPPGR